MVDFGPLPPGPNTPPYVTRAASMQSPTSSSIFGVNNTSSVTGSSATETSSPLWLTDAAKGMVARAAEEATQPYQAYGGQRVQPFDPMQTQAYNQVQQNQGMWKPNVNSAQVHMETGTSRFNQEALNPFLSPYISGVVDEMGRLGTRQYQENILPQTLSPFVGAGQFGSTRSMDFANRASRDFGADLAGRQGVALQGAYDSAMKNYGDWSQRQIQGGQQLGALGQLQAKLGLSDAQSLEAAGAQRQFQGQQALDIGYQNFLQQRDYPKAQLDFLRSMISGIPSSSQVYQTTSRAPTQAPASPLAQSLAAFSGTTGWFDALRNNLGQV